MDWRALVAGAITGLFYSLQLLGWSDWWMWWESGCQFRLGVPPLSLPVWPRHPFGWLLTVWSSLCVGLINYLPILPAWDVCIKGVQSNSVCLRPSWSGLASISGREQNTAWAEHDHTTQHGSETKTNRPKRHERVHEASRQVDCHPHQTDRGHHTNQWVHTPSFASVWIRLFLVDTDGNTNVLYVYICHLMGRIQLSANRIRQHILGALFSSKSWSRHLKTVQVFTQNYTGHSPKYWPRDPFLHLLFGLVAGVPRFWSRESEASCTFLCYTLVVLFT